MLDIEEFRLAKKRLFDKKESISSLADLETYIADLEVVSTNERSYDLVNLLNDTIEIAKPLKSNQCLFKLYTMYFQQIFYYAQNIKESKKIVNEMQIITKETRNPEHIAYVKISNALVSRLLGDIKESDELTNEAMKIIQPSKDKYPDTFHRISYIYSMIKWSQDNSFSEAIDILENCVSFWQDRYHALPMIRSIFRLLRLYSYYGDDKKFNEIMHWIFSEQRIQDGLLDTHFAVLYSYVGRILTIRSEISQAVVYLKEAYDILKPIKDQHNLMYEYTEIQKLLCRCYAFQGMYQESYDVFLEFLSFIESDYVKDNYYKSRYKQVYLSAYYTLLFMFVQLNVQVSDMEDDKLRNIFLYTQRLLKESKIPEDLLLDTSLNESNAKNLTNEKFSKPDELYLNLHQQLLSLETHTATEDTIKKIYQVRDYVHNPLYADIVVTKILLAIGKFDEFKNSVSSLKNQVNKADTPILQLWVKLFDLLKSYIENPGDKKLLTKFTDLEKYCRDTKFLKMAEEVDLYQRLIVSSRTSDSLGKRFNQTAFTDLYDFQSRKMVVEFLERKEKS